MARRGPLVLLDEQLKHVIVRAMHCLVNSKPRQVEAWSEGFPIILFTDGACENEGALVTHGAVLFDPESNLALMLVMRSPMNGPRNGSLRDANS